MKGTNYIVDGSKASENIKNVLAGTMAAVKTGSDLQSGAKTGSDIKGVETVGSAEDYVQASKDVAAQKAGELKAASAALRKTGMVDTNGDLTQEAKDAMQRKDERGFGEQLSSSGFLDDKEGLKNIYAKMIDKFGGKKALKQMADDGFITKEDAAKVQFGANGKVVSDSITPADADSVATAVGVSQGHKLGESMKSMIINGYAVKNHGTAVGGNRENKSIDSSGSREEFASNQEDYQQMLVQFGGDEAKAQAMTRLSRAADFATSKGGIIGNASAGLEHAAAGVDKVFGTNLAGYVKEHPDESVNTLLEVAGVGTVGYLANRFGKTTKTSSEWQNKKFDPEDPNNVMHKEGVKTDSFSVDKAGNMFDAEGNQVKEGVTAYKDGRGNSFAVDNEGNVLNPEGNPVKEKVTTSKKVGGIERAGGALKDGLKKGAWNARDALVGFFSDSKESSDSTTNPGDNEISTKKNEKIDNPAEETVKTEHKTPPILDKDSITNKSEKSNIAAAAEKVDAVDSKIEKLQALLMSRWEGTRSRLLSTTR